MLACKTRCSLNPSVPSAVDKPVTELVTEPVYSLRLWRYLFLSKLQAFTINGSEGNSDRVCDFRFQLQAVIEFVFNEFSGF